MIPKLQSTTDERLSVDPDKSLSLLKYQRQLAYRQKLKNKLIKVFAALVVLVAVGGGVTWLLARNIDEPEIPQPTPTRENNPEVVWPEAEVLPTGEKLWLFSSLREANNAVLAAHPKTNVIGYGEVHAEEYAGYVPAITRFAEGIQPSLNDHLFYDLILEAVPNDPLVNSELNSLQPSLNLSTRGTPQLYASLRVGNIAYESETLGYLCLFESVLKDGMFIHGGGPNIEWANFTIRQPDYPSNQEEVDLVAGLVRDSAFSRTMALRQRGFKVAIFTGCWHNNLSAEEYGTSEIDTFGPFFINEPTVNYVAIDLLIPERRPELCFDLPDLEQYFPRQGVVVISPKSASYFFLLPRT